MAENAAPGTLVGDRVTAFDNDANTITYSFARNPDADSFTLDAQTGQIAVATGASLDFEVKNSYAVTVRASDRQGGADAIAVTIAVTNVDEAGAVSLSSEDPRIGTPLEAMLTDPDGGMADVSWQWERSPDQTSWLAVFGANAGQLHTDRSRCGPTSAGDGVVQRQPRSGQAGAQGNSEPCPRPSSYPDANSGAANADANSRAANYDADFGAHGCADSGAHGCADSGTHRCADSGTHCCAYGDSDGCTYGSTYGCTHGGTHGSTAGNSDFGCSCGCG